MRPAYLSFALAVLGFLCLAKGYLPPPPCKYYNPCRNGGVCIENYWGTRCQCIGPYTGKRCETAINACLSNPCLGRGTCAVGSQNPRHWYCICPPGKTGLRCEKVIHDCSSEPCQNGGSCCENQNGYTCDCKPGFTGNYCETDIDECLSEPCQNGGTCVDQVNGYSCSCRVGLEGRHCERKKPGCHNSTCLNGGSCVESSDRMWYCVCPKTHKGIQCEQQVNDCSSHPCQNGGSCCDKGNRYECECPDGYTGKHCETEIISPSSTSTAMSSSSITCCVPNHGTCVVSASQSATCSCYSLFYYGPRCEFEHNPCTRSPCGSMASCSKIAADLYTCISSSVAITPSTALITSCFTRSISPSPSSSLTPTTTLTSSSTATATMSPTTTLTSSSTVTPTTSPCGCLNGGTCLSNGECYCPIGLGGPKCEYYTDYCLCNPCMNGGTCREQREGYSCSCRPGFYGSNCASGTSSWTTTILSSRSISPSPSSSSCNCVHGRCVSATCFCGLHYYGPRCEYEHNPCTRMYACPSSMSCSKISGDQYTCLPQSPSLTPTTTLTSSSTVTPTIIYDHICDISSPCRHGQCIKIPTFPHYRCQCDPGYFGFLCQTPALSTPTVSSSSASPCGCLNGGTCLSNGECYCPIGLGGPKCGYYTDYCLCNPCMNGGTCREQREGYSCSCRPGFYGSNCASASVVTYSPSNTLRTTTPPLRWTGHSHTTAPRTSEYRTTTVLAGTTSLPPTSSASSSVVMKKRSRRENKKNDEITEVEDKELKRICKQNKRKARKFFINKQLDKKTWNKLHPGIQSVLIDLVANNDHRRLSGTHAQIKNAVAQNDLSKMAQIMADRSLWKRVPVARYWKRKQMMKKAVKKPWSSLVTSKVVC